ncbi:MAG: 3-keto-disaccharide hydrolase [Actinomycetota bacterium]
MTRRNLIAAGALLCLGAPLSPAGVRAQSLADTDVMKLPAPRGATVLFDGSDLSKWVNRKGGAAGWTVRDGYLEVKPGNGDIITRDRFQDYRLHLEFWLPLMADAQGQARANSGVYNQGRIEVQVLDSYGQPPRDNEAGGIYQVAVPLRNGSKKPQKWQSYDIFYRAPRIGAGGKQTEKGRITVLHNGLMIHHNVAFDARTTTSGLPPENNDYSLPGPILLQDHGNLVRYRNIWIVPNP